MEFFLINQNKLDIYKSKTREYAIKKINWVNYKDEVKKVFVESKLSPLQKNTVNLINKYDNSTYPLITK